MKKVFSSNKQVCHVWAQQTQSEGRSGNIFFRDSLIFSYGEHYMAAKIHNVKGQRFALINVHRYSVTTSQHLGDIRNALSGLMPYFDSPDVTDVKKAVEWLDGQARGRIGVALKRMKVTNERSIKWEFESINEGFEEANKLRKLLGRATIAPKKAELDAVEKHLRARLKRYHELNTPEMIEKRAKDAEKRAAAKERAELRKAAEQIEKFRRGEYVSLYNLPYELLRIKGDVVQTSRGAEVPLCEAKKLYKALTLGLDVKGKTVGHYTVIGVYPHLNADLTETKLVQIGCHKILLSEAAQVLGVA